MISAAAATIIVRTAIVSSWGAQVVYFEEHFNEPTLGLAWSVMGTRSYDLLFMIADWGGDAYYNCSTGAGSFFLLLTMVGLGLMRLRIRPSTATSYRWPSQQGPHR